MIMQIFITIMTMAIYSFNYIDRLNPFYILKERTGLNRTMFTVVLKNGTVSSFEFLRKSPIREPYSTYVLELLWYPVLYCTVHLPTVFFLPWLGKMTQLKGAIS
jgi:hypothetical protein